MPQTDRDLVSKQQLQEPGRIMTDLQELFLNFDGRINRSKYWLGVCINIGLVLVASFFFDMADYLGVLVALVAFLAAFALCIPIGIKRLHDRDKSGWWLLLFYVAPAVLDWISRLTEAFVPASLIGLVGLGISVWTLVELGFLPGTDGTNHYGANPLKGGGWRTA
jgi:uncharacterized membrane protein YhaH (DUF805 family)